jgi:hypothetical protein
MGAHFSRVTFFVVHCILLFSKGMNYIGAFLLLVFKSCESNLTAKDQTAEKMEDQSMVELDIGEVGTYEDSDDESVDASTFDALAGHLTLLRISSKVSESTLPYEENAWQVFVCIIDGLMPVWFKKKSELVGLQVHHPLKPKIDSEAKR